MESMTTVLREFEGCRFFVRGETFDIVAKDVAEKILNLRWNGSQTIEGVPKEWKGVAQNPTLNNIEEILTLSEQGLYFFLARSNSPKALPFQKKVAELVTTLRQKGKVELAPQTREQRLALAFRDAMEIISEKDAQLAAAAPKVEHYDRFANAKGRYGLQQAARILGQHPNKWIEKLRTDGYLFYQGKKLVPKVEHSERGLFEVKEGESDGKAYCQTYVTPKGLQYFGARVGSLTLIVVPAL